MTALARLISFVAAAATAGPALAAPPVLPSDDARKALDSYMAAIDRNDLGAYAALFADDATIAVGDGAPLTKAQWIAASENSFRPERRARFTSVFGRWDDSHQRPGGKFLLTIDETRCHPRAFECFSEHRTETLTVAAGKIVDLRLSASFTHKLAPNGAWTFFPDRPGGR